jgi:hypothetical protein
MQSSQVLPFPIQIELEENFDKFTHKLLTEQWFQDFGQREWFFRNESFALDAVKSHWESLCSFVDCWIPKLRYPTRPNLSSAVFLEYRQEVQKGAENLRSYLSTLVAVLQLGVEEECLTHEDVSTVAREAYEAQTLLRDQGRFTKESLERIDRAFFYATLGWKALATTVIDDQAFWERESFTGVDPDFQKRMLQLNLEGSRRVLAAHNCFDLEVPTIEIETFKRLRDMRNGRLEKEKIFALQAFDALEVNGAISGEYRRQTVEKIENSLSPTGSPTLLSLTRKYQEFRKVFEDSSFQKFRSELCQFIENKEIVRKAIVELTVFRIHLRDLPHKCTVNDVKAKEREICAHIPSLWRKNIEAFRQWCGSEDEVKHPFLKTLVRALASLPISYPKDPPSTIQQAVESISQVRNNLWGVSSRVVALSERVCEVERRGALFGPEIGEKVSIELTARLSQYMKDPCCLAQAENLLMAENQVNALEQELQKEELLVLKRFEEKREQLLKLAWSAYLEVLNANVAMGKKNAQPILALWERAGTLLPLSREVSFIEVEEAFSTFEEEVKNTKNYLLRKMRIQEVFFESFGANTEQWIELTGQKMAHMSAIAETTAKIPAELIFFSGRTVSLKCSKAIGGLQFTLKEFTQQNEIGVFYKTISCSAKLFGDMPETLIYIKPFNKSSANFASLYLEEKVSSDCHKRMASDEVTNVVMVRLRNHENSPHAAKGICMPFYELNGLKLMLRHPHLSEITRLKIVRDAARGLAKMHASGWVHGNFHPENLLIQCKGNELIGYVANFRHAKKIHDMAIPGLLAYMPKEAINPEFQASVSTDEFSLGVFILEMFKGHAANKFRDLSSIGKIVSSVSWDLAHRRTVESLDRAEFIDELILQLLDSIAENRPPATYVTRKIQARIDEGILLR